MIQFSVKTRKHVFLAASGLALITSGFGVAQYLRGPSFVAGNEVDIQAIPVTLQDGHALMVQTREVTIAAWQVCHQAGACALKLPIKDRETAYPATGLSYVDAMQYVAWINSNATSNWRLPSAAEWGELAAEVTPDMPVPIFTEPSLTWASSYLSQSTQTARALRPSGSFSETSDGIQDLDGNVLEWTSDCYAGASGQGDVIDIDRCPAFVMGGEHQAVMSYLVRDPARGGCAVGIPPAHLGMRLVSDGSS